MKKAYSLKIDAYSHIAPSKYMEALGKVSPEDFNRAIRILPLHDIECRFRIMDKYEGLVQVLTLHRPVIQEIADPQKAIELIELGNNEMAELVVKYPDRFVAAIAGLPMNDVDAALKEVDRTIRDLKFRGVLVHSNEYGKPLDSPELMPLYDKMSQYNLPIYIHPHREPDFPDYKTEKTSKYHIYNTFGWPYETTAAMTCLVFSGVLEQYPELKIVTHHAGGMVPYFYERIKQHYDVFEMGNRAEYMQGLTKTPVEYYKMFYNDTAIHGNTMALMCACAFCGADHLLLGADMPWGDRQWGDRSYRQTINAIEEMNITDDEKRQIFEENAKRLLRLPV